MEITTFRNFKGKTPESSTIEAIVEQIRSSQSLAQITALYRQSGSKPVKEESPMFAVAALMSGGKAKEHITRMTGMSLVDLDHVPAERMAAVIKAVVDDPHTLLVYTTISGAGLRIIFKYELDEERDLEQQMKFYTKAFEAGNSHYEKITGMDADRQCKNVNRLSGLAHDPGVYYNPAATPFTAEEVLSNSHDANRERSKMKSHSRIQDYFDRVIAPRLEAEDIHYVVGNHNQYVMRTGYMLAAKRYNHQTCMEWAKEQFSDYADTCQVMRSCFDNANGSTGGREKLPAATIADIKAFLDRSIQLRQNVISGRIEYFNANETDENERWKPFVDRTLNTLWADMAQQFWVRKTEIADIVNSSYTPLFNPFKHYLDSLPQWHEGDHDYLRDLADTVRVKGGSTLSFYEVLRKWLVAMVAAWIGKTTVNHIVLVLIGEQGAYKTTWLNYLLPPELRNYFYTKVNINRTTRDEMVNLSRYALMCYEELDCMTSTDLNRLKGIVTMEHVDEREPYARYAEHRPHIASFCGTGNNVQFLTDPTGNRRWMPFEVESITSPREHPFNYEGIYSQVYTMLLSGFRYYFSKEEIQIQNRHNSQFEAPNMELELVSTHFRRPNEGETPTFMTASRALQLFGTGITQKLNVVRIGKAFRDLGFATARCGDIRGYWVIERSAEEIQMFLKNVPADVKS